MLNGVPTAEDCAPVIKHYEDNAEGETNDNPEFESNTIICKGKCTLQLVKDTDGGISNRAIADATKKITKECGDKADGKVPGSLLTSDGKNDFFLSVYMPGPGGCGEMA